MKELKKYLNTKSAVLCKNSSEFIEVSKFLVSLDFFTQNSNIDEYDCRVLYNKALMDEGYTLCINLITGGFDIVENYLKQNYKIVDREGNDLLFDFVKDKQNKFKLFNESI
jgi:hypothetical protein